MPTYISMLKWSGAPPPDAAGVRASLELRSPLLRSRGMHSVVFLPDEGECAAVMVSTCANEDGPRDLAHLVCPGTTVVVDTTLFEDDGRTHVHVSRKAVPPRPETFTGKVLQAIVAGP